MIRLKLDLAGCLHPDWGITPQQCNSLRDPLSSIRDEMIAAAERSPDTSFLQLPWQQHSEYQQDREDSLLGRIFKIANSSRDDIDAVVVLGSKSATEGACALMQACCDPYHNELSRAARGSKPRMYFIGGNADSDSISSLLNRLTIGGDMQVESRWALIVMDGEDSENEAAIVLQKFIAGLKTSLGDDAEHFISRFFIPVLRTSGWLQDLATAHNCEITLDLPAAINPQFSVLSAQSMLPAAMLGLDCMKLLGGAHEMTTHFAEADYAENAILQFVAVNKLMSSNHGRKLRMSKTWSNALAALLKWYESTFPELNFASVPNEVNDQVIHQLVVQTPRCDPIMVAKGDQQRELRSLSDDTIRQANLYWQECGQPTTKIILPDTDFFAIGELFQFLMIASAMETK